MVTPKFMEQLGVASIIAGSVMFVLARAWKAAVQ